MTAAVGTDSTSPHDQLPLLQVIVGSTRPGRVGLPVAEWFVSEVAEPGPFDVELVDLAEVNLPMFDEPRHPRLGQYEHEHTHRWSATVARADAFVMVVPEYNYSYNAALKNAIDYLYDEWHHKPVGFVSYGGAGAGTRAVQALKQVVTTLRMVPIFESVNIPFVAKLRTEDGRIEPTAAMSESAMSMTAELARWVEPLSGLRNEAGLRNGAGLRDEAARSSTDGHSRRVRRDLLSTRTGTGVEP